MNAVVSQEIVKSDCAVKQSTVPHLDLNYHLLFYDIINYVCYRQALPMQRTQMPITPRTLSGTPHLTTTPGTLIHSSQPNTGTHGTTATGRFHCKSRLYYSYVCVHYRQRVWTQARICSPKSAYHSLFENALVSVPSVCTKFPWTHTLF